MILYMGSMVALFGNFFLQVLLLPFQLFSRLLEALHPLISVFFILLM